MATLLGIPFLIITWLCNLGIFFLIASAVLSLVQANPSNPIVGAIQAVTLPPTRWLRNRFPFLLVQGDGGMGIDLSPLVLSMGLVVLRIISEQVQIALHTAF